MKPIYSNGKLGKELAYQLGSIIDFPYSSCTYEIREQLMQNLSERLERPLNIQPLNFI